MENLQEACLPHTLKIMGEESSGQPVIRPHPEKCSADLIIIDDDKTLTTAWTLCGEMAGKCVVAFNQIANFKLVMSHYDKNIPIYLDVNLNDELSGKEFSKELHDIGFTNLYLVTGYPPEHFEEMPWIKQVLGKEWPF